MLKITASHYTLEFQSLHSEKIVGSLDIDDSKEGFLRIKNEYSPKSIARFVTAISLSHKDFHFTKLTVLICSKVILIPSGISSQEIEKLFS